MPYSDPEEQKAYRRAWYRAKLETDGKFRKKESERKKEWFKDNEEAHEQVRLYQARKRNERSKGVLVKLRDDELEKLKAQARKEGIQVRTLIRRRALEGLD